jgi:hypothetical protein
MLSPYGGVETQSINESPERLILDEASRNRIGDFQCKLQRDWRYVNHEDRKYYDIKAIICWMKEFTGGIQNGKGLYHAVMASRTGLPYPYEYIMEGENPCIKVWITLFDANIDRPDLITFFFNAGINDENFTKPHEVKSKLLALKHDLKTKATMNDKDSNNLICNFREIRWSTDPMYFTYKMNKKLKGNPIVAISKLERINDKGAQGRVYQAFIPKNFVDPELKNILSDPTKHHERVEVCISTLKLYQKLITTRITLLLSRLLKAKLEINQERRT